MYYGIRISKLKKKIRSDVVLQYRDCHVCVFSEVYTEVSDQIRASYPQSMCPRI